MEDDCKFSHSTHTVVPQLPSTNVKLASNESLEPTNNNWVDNHYLQVNRGDL